MEARYRSNPICAGMLAHFSRKGCLRGGMAAILLPLFASQPAAAFEIDAGNPDVRLRWDNTVKYSAGYRVKDRLPELVNGHVNLDDGDRNFEKGLISNRVDLLSEMDLAYSNFGARISGAAWYDSVYNSKTDNDSAATYNPVSVPNTEFTKATRDLHGRKAELLDAFVFGKGEIGDMNGSFRLGRHSLLWGESLFFGENGIAGTQAPVDLIKLLSVPNTQFKELIRPTNQVSGQLQLNQNVSLGAYYQLGWEENRIPASGSYFSRSDIFDRGGERLIAAITPGGPLAFLRTQDQEAKSSGQGGLQLRWRPSGSDYDFGFYAVRFHSRNFVVHVRPTGGAPVLGVLGSYNLVYPEGIKAFGASVSKSVGSTNIAAEVSTRRDTPLVAKGGSVTVLPGQISDNNDNPLYPVGNSVHAQVSAIHTLERNDLWDGGLVLAEIAWHRRTSVTKNGAALEPASTRDAAGLRTIFSPTWYQAMPGLDLSMPVGLGYNFGGKSSVITLFNGGSSNGGDFSVGLTGDYLQTWKGGINYTHYYGAANSVLDNSPSFTYQQSLKDRDFLSITVSRTF